MAQAEVVFWEEPRARSFWAELLIRLFKEKRLGATGAVIVVGLLILGVFAQFIAPYPYDATLVCPRLSPPSGGHILGCDQLGRDLLSRIIYGARISMIIGLSVGALSVSVSTIIGTISGYFGGRFDMILQRFIDAWMCIPGLMITLTLASIVGPGMLMVILVLGFGFAVGQSRIVRGAVMGVKGNTYVEAAKAIGCRTGRILLRHILPNVAAPMIILFTLSVGGAIMYEALMSFLGLGVPPPAPSWGGMVSDAGARYMYVAPHLAFWPGVFLAIAIYGINVLGDALRDLLDPRLRGGLGRYDLAAKKLRQLTKGGGM